MTCLPSWHSTWLILHPWNVYCQTSNISHILLVGNRIVDHSDEVGASPVGTAPTMHCSNYIVILDLTLGFNRLHKDNCKTRWETFKFGDLVWQFILLINSLRRVAFYHIFHSSHQSRNPSESLHRAWQLYCRALWKISQGFVKWKIL